MNLGISVYGMNRGISVQEAIRRLGDGEVIAIPTETVYGLAASVQHPDALASIYTLKGRPKDNPMILHGASVDQLLPFVEGWSEAHQACADAFWPGPLTLILRASEQVPSIVTAGLDTVAIRIPNHPMALEILEHIGPLAAPSANLSGSPSATKASHVLDDFGNAVAVVDGDQAAIGLESTVVWAVDSPWRILRPGVIGADEIGHEANIMVNPTPSHHVPAQPAEADQTPLSPGTKYRHYTPMARVMWLDLNQIEAASIAPVQPRLFVVTHTEDRRSQIQTLTQKHPSMLHQHAGSLDMLAKHLYEWFREADQRNTDTIFIEGFEATTPLGLSLTNRISKTIG
ncbi:MAG: L-threonylcarbamoyladenylate synthase [Bacteroidetes bacterium]|nr:L-threonylcarbamoyladenylate synthase [Bacteroidota bacterium]